MSKREGGVLKAGNLRRDCSCAGRSTRKSTGVDSLYFCAFFHGCELRQIHSKRRKRFHLGCLVATLPVYPERSVYTRLARTPLFGRRRRTSWRTAASTTQV